MKKFHWLLLGIGSILLWGGIILCLLIVLHFGSESFSREKLVDASEEAYRFDPRKILTESDNMHFDQIPFPEKLPEVPLITIFWQQEEYLQVIDSFMRNILHEDISTWELINIGATRFCSNEKTGLPNFGVNLQKSISFIDGNHRMEADISLEPQTGVIILLKREYAPDEGGERTLRWGEIKIPAEQALLIAEENGGTIVREALGNQCRIIISLKAGIQNNDWWIYYEPINKPSVFEVAVDERTGKHRILRKFER